MATARGGGWARTPPPGKKFGKISHKNRDNQEKWEEKGQIGKKMGSLPGACPCGREGLATALPGMMLRDSKEYSQEPANSLGKT